MSPVEGTYHCKKCSTVMEMRDYQVVEWYNWKADFCEECRKKLSIDQHGFPAKDDSNWMQAEDLNE